MNCLCIQNLILIERACLSFSKGLNVLTGETGSGKSAVIEAISLVLGARADTKAIRKGAEKAVVEALFRIEGRRELLALLKRGGVDVGSDEELLIRRELFATGKSRSFVNHQLVQLHFLKGLGEHLIKFVGQHANQALFSSNQHRILLDRYGGLDPKAALFEKSWRRLASLEERLRLFEADEGTRLRELELAEREVREITEVALHPGEDETLFAEYSRLSQIEELNRLAEEALQLLSYGEGSLAALLNRLRRPLKRLAEIDSSLGELVESHQKMTAESQEAAFLLERSASSSEADPRRLEEIDLRLKEIHRLQTRYGATIPLILDYLAARRADCERLSFPELEREALERALAEERRLVDKLADELSAERRRVACDLERAVEKELEKLKMGESRFCVRISLQKRSSFGDDCVEFFIAPNAGEHPASIKQAASGGELSRVMLALQALLAGKESIPSLVFDEVDAGIGGLTAAAVGERLKEISLCHQVICVTHFPQVARLAECHLGVEKRVKGERTFTEIVELDGSEREAELGRMVGDPAFADSKF